MRRDPPPPPEVKPKDSDTLTTRTYRLITPLFGGGVETQAADPVTLIRGSSVRGQLRFWWRATRGGAFGGDLGAMKAAESAIWGAAAVEGGAGPSRVSLQVTVVDEGTGKRPFTLRPGRSFPDANPDVAPPYAAFPLQPNNNDRAEKEVRVGVRFSLELRYPSPIRADVEAALWAWETFGGIGARTRRGFGALASLEPSEARAGDLTAWIEQQLKNHVEAGLWPEGVPHLPRAAADFRLTGLAWAELVEAYKGFRQKRNKGSDPSAPNRPGRSKWPEPDAVRALTGQSVAKHKTPIHDPSIAKFPRAVFGLPIIFHFQGGGDPRDTSLEGPEHDRLSSPLILRPLEIGGQSYGLALVLEAPRTPPGGLKLAKAKGEPLVAHSLTADEARRIEPLNGNTNVLRAFLDSLPALPAGGSPR